MELKGSWTNDVLGFWFSELQPEDWFQQSDSVDRQIRERFFDLHGAVSSADLDKVAIDGNSALAAVLVLDQFSRNMFRKTADAFASDAKALGIARRAIDRDLDKKMSNDERMFLYMPFMHSEQLPDQDRSVELFRSLGNENSLKYAIEHREIIARFGRFPYRNLALGRTSTAEEVSFTEGHSGYGQ